MAENLVALARRQDEAWNARDFDSIVELTDPEATITLVGSGEVLRGKEGALQYAKMWADGFPDGKTSEFKYVSEGDTVVTEFVGRGTHTGTLNGPAGAIPATGKSVTLQLCQVTEFRNGKTIAVRAYVDTAALLTQLGILPATEAARK